MQTATNNHTTTSPATPRPFAWPLPGFLGFALSAVTAGLQVPPIKETADPVLDLCDRYRAIEDEQAQIEPLADIIRSCLTAKWGKLPSAYTAWADDPDSAELTQLTLASDVCTDRLCSITDELMVTPATTLAGLRAKLQIALELWPATDGDLHEDVALAFMRDAVRLLGETRA